MVLRRQRLRDTQDLLVLFTPEGRLDCVVRVNAKRAGLLEPLTCIQVQVKLGRSLPQLQEATLERHFTRLSADLERLYWAGYLVQLWLEAFPEESHESHPYRLLRVALEGLDGGVECAWLGLWTELQVLRLLGVAPELTACVVCGRGETARWSSEAGGAVCPNCARPGSRNYPPALGELLRFVWRAPLDRLASQCPPPELLEAARRLIHPCVLTQFPGLARFDPERHQP